MARFGADNPKYAEVLGYFNGLINAAENGHNLFSWEEHNRYFMPSVFEPLMEQYNDEEKRLVACNLAWEFAERYGYPKKLKHAAREIAKIAVMMTRQYVADEDWAKLTKKMGIKNNKKTNQAKKQNPENAKMTAEQQKELTLRQMACLQKLPATSENVMRYAKLLFNFSIDYWQDETLSVGGLRMMLEKNADEIGLNNEQQIMPFMSKSQDRKISKKLVKEVVETYGKYYEEAYCIDQLNDKFVSKMGDMVTKIVRDYKYSKKDLADLEKSAGMFGEVNRKQWNYMIRPYRPRGNNRYPERA